MEASLEDSENTPTNSTTVEMILPQALYSAHLTTIKEIAFTNREIDVIACVLGGRSVKKIASFLQISPRTVETHIRNVLLKIGGQSQENIIDFIENSEKFNLVRQYYSSLTIHCFFEFELKKISTEEVKNKNPTCLIVRDPNIKTFIDQIENTLLVAGIKTSNIHLQNNKNIDTFLNKLDSEKIDFILLCLPLPSLQENVTAAYSKNTKNKEIFEVLLQLQVNKLESPRFLILDKKWQEITDKQISRLKTINLSDHCYYFLIIEILKFIFSNTVLEKRFVKFKQKFDNIMDSSLSESLSKRNHYPKILNKKESHLKLNKQFLNQRNLQVLFVVFIVLWVLYLIYAVTIKDSQVVNQRTEEQSSFQNARTTFNMESISTAKRVEAGKNVTWNLPRQDNKFIGRKNVLQKIEEEALQGFSSLHDRNKMAIAQKAALIAVCTGLGGVGKTQLALQYIHHAKYPYNLRAWFYSENKELLKSQYIAFAKELGLEEQEPSLEMVISFIKEWLAEHPGWLLVYDNVTNYEDIKNFLPVKGGSIILTTRSKRWPTNFKTFDIEVMTESEAIELISSLAKRNVNNIEEENEIKELIKRLGYLPLAIAQAGAYISQSSLSFAEYLKLYKNHEQDLLQDNSKPEGTYSLPVAATWNISLETIANEAQKLHQDPLALNLLMACAYLAPEKIPKEILMAWLKEIEPNCAADLVLPKLLNQLWQYSMIKRDDKSITVHRLVQSILRQQHKQLSKYYNFNKMTLTPEWYNTLLKVFDAAFCNNNNVLELEQRQIQLLSHLQALVEYYDEIWKNSHSNPLILAKVLFDIGHVLRFQLGEAQASKLYYTRALTIQRNHYTSDNIEIAKTLEGLGDVYRESGDNITAKKYLTQALTIFENLQEKNKVVNLEFPRVLHNLASVYRRSGDPITAKKYLERALSLGEIYCQKDSKHCHLEISLILAKLGNVYVNLGDTVKAKYFLNKAINISQQQYGKAHKWVSDPLNNLGNAYIAEGNYADAKGILEKVLKIREANFGNEHRWLSLSLKNLGYAYANLGETKPGIALLERSINIEKKQYGENYYSVAITLRYLGNAYLISGEVNKAKELLEQALEIEKGYYNKNHPEIASTLISLSEVYYQLNNLQKSKQLLEHALKIKEEHYNADNPERAKALLVLAKIYIKNNQLELAKPLALNCYQLFLKEYGPNSSFTKQALQLASCLIK